MALCAVTLGFGVAFAQARPISAYRGTIGDAAVEVMLIHDWQLDGISPPVSATWNARSRTAGAADARRSCICAPRV